MGAPLTVGDTVVAAAAAQFLNVGCLVHTTPMRFGKVESCTPGAGPTDPPTAVTVAWSDGTRTLYAVVGSGATSVLYNGGGVATSLLLGSYAGPTGTSGIPNPGGRTQGPVVQQIPLQDPAGAAAGEVCIVKAEFGYLAASRSNLIAVPGR